MQGLPRIHYQSRGSATYEAPLDILIPALMKMRECDDSLKALVLIDSLPDLLLPALAFAVRPEHWYRKAVDLRSSASILLDAVRPNIEHYEAALSVAQNMTRIVFRRNSRC
jgi:hypothetical protein